MLYYKLDTYELAELIQSTLFELASQEGIGGLPHKGCTRLSTPKRSVDGKWLVEAVVYGVCLDEYRDRMELETVVPVMASAQGIALPEGFQVPFATEEEVQHETE